MLKIDFLISNTVFQKFSLSTDMYGFIAISVTIIVMMTLAKH